MKGIILLSLFIVACFAIATANHDQENDHHELDDHFKEYLTKFGKKFDHWDNAKKQRRNKRFNQVRDEVHAHNADKHKTYEIEINQFADRDAEDYPRFMGLDMSHAINSRSLPAFNNITLTPPTSIDYRYLVQSPIKDQGDCGCCWAVATLDMIEIVSKLANKPLAPLSVQQLVDCDTTDGGCDGGWPTDALLWLQSIKNFSMTFDANYPYTSGTTGTIGVCRNENFPHTYFPIKNIMTANNFGNELQAMKILNAYGPQVIAMQVPSCTNFFGYKSGVYVDTCGCAKNICGAINHAVVLMGYGKDATTGLNYWLIKNSWGANWGENGYMRILRDSTNRCNTICYLFGIEL